jgi:hypothetical protein
LKERKRTSLFLVSLHGVNRSINRCLRKLCIFAGASEIKGNVKKYSFYNDAILTLRSSNTYKFKGIAGYLCSGWWRRVYGWAISIFQCKELTGATSK